MKFCWVTKCKGHGESTGFLSGNYWTKINKRFKPDNDREIVFLGDGETQIELIYNSKTDDINIGESISLGFEVESLEKIGVVLEKKGISIHSGPFSPNPSIRFMYVLDPNGVKVQFVENL